MYKIISTSSRIASVASRLVLIISLAAASFGALVPETAQASVTDFATNGTMHGYAWSGDIGWISLNCAEGSATGGSVCATSNYGVILTSGGLSGYAWSSGLGWISFVSAEVFACASSGTAPVMNPSTGAISGFARVRSPMAGGSGSWDGCISLRGTSTVGSSYGVTYSTTTPPPVVGSPGIVLPGHGLTGYGWGALNLGWVDFEYASISFTPTAFVRLYSDYGGVLYGTGVALTIPSSGGSVPLVWQTLGMDPTCPYSTSTGGIAFPGSSPRPSVEPSGWTASPSTPPTLPAGYPYVVTLPANTTTAAKTYTFTIGCTPVGSTINATSSVAIIVPPPAVLSCAISPSSSGVTLTTAAGSATATFSGGITWTGASPASNTMSVDTSSAGSLTAAVTGGASVLTGAPFSITVTWPAGVTGAPFTIPITASSAASPGVTCSANVTVGAAAPGPNHHLPWIEF